VAACGYCCSLRLGDWMACSPAFCIQAEVAQLVEQLIRNQQVTGSSPVFGSTYILLVLSILHFIAKLILR
jgi:hypothetical protein